MTLKLEPGMRLDEYAALDATDLAAAIRRGEASATAVYDTARAAMLAVNDQLSFLVGETPDEARRNLAGLAADAPLHGVPTLAKDIGPRIAGVPQEMGCGLAAGLVPDSTSEIMRRFQAAGLVFMGRTATPEMGAAFTTEPRVGKPTRNPWDTTRSTGGSSGGAAAAVASGVVPIALAGDSAGSIRVPAHACGIFGFKPSRGVNPTGPEAGETNNGSTVAHVLTRTVRDSAAALDATRGPDPGCRYATAPPSRPFVQAAAEPPRRLRIAVSVRNPMGGEVAQDVCDAAFAAADLCTSFGHTVEEADPPIDGDELAHAFEVIWSANMNHGITQLGLRAGRAPSLETLEAATLALWRRGAGLSAADLLASLGSVNQLSRRMGVFFEQYDVLVSPAFSRTAPRLGEIRVDDPTLTAASYVRESLNWAPFTSQFNLTGQPAMSVPLYESPDGLPIGVHFAAAYGRDELLFALAGQLEVARPWRDRRPPVHVIAARDLVA